MALRSSLQWSLACAMLATSLMGANCRSEGKPGPLGSDAATLGNAPPPNEGLTESEATKLLPGIDTSMLTPKQRQELVELSRDTFCPCSADTVAGCVRKTPMTCKPAVRLLELSKKLLLAGMPEARALLVVESYYSGFDDAHRVDLAQDGPFRGAENASIVLEEFSDFQCPVCRAAHPVLSELIKKNGEQLKWIFRNFPLPQHEHAMKAALCGVYGFDKGGNNAFWKMADYFYGHQDQLGDDIFKAAAKEAGLNGDQMLSVIEKDPKYAAKVDSDKNAGMAAKIGGTPTIFINGRQFVLPVTVDFLTWAIDDEREWVANGKKWASK